MNEIEEHPLRLNEMSQNQESDADKSISSTGKRQVRWDENRERKRQKKNSEKTDQRDGISNVMEKIESGQNKIGINSASHDGSESKEASSLSVFRVEDESLGESMKYSNESPSTISEIGATVEQNVSKEKSPGVRIQPIMPKLSVGIIRTKSPPDEKLFSPMVPITVRSEQRVTAPPLIHMYRSIQPRPPAILGAGVEQRRFVTVMCGGKRLQFAMAPTTTATSILSPDVTSRLAVGRPSGPASTTVVVLPSPSSQMNARPAASSIFTNASSSMSTTSTSSAAVRPMQPRMILPVGRQPPRSTTSGSLGIPATAIIQSQRPLLLPRLDDGSGPVAGCVPSLSIASRPLGISRKNDGTSTANNKSNDASSTTTGSEKWYIDQLRTNPAFVAVNTGMGLDVFNALAMDVRVSSPFVESTNSIGHDVELLLTLIRIKSLAPSDLEFLFDLNTKVVNDILLRWIPYLGIRMKPLVAWLSVKADYDDCVPNVVQYALGGETSAVLDIVEVKVPNETLTRVKLAVILNWNGVVVCRSRLFPRRTADWAVLQAFQKDLERTTSNSNKSSTAAVLPDKFVVARRSYCIVDKRFVVVNPATHIIKHLSSNLQQFAIFDEHSLLRGLRMEDVITVCCAMVNLRVLSDKDSKKKKKE